MNHSHDSDQAGRGTSSAPITPLTDDELASVIRDVAESWTMPPVPLNEAGWRDRVLSPGARRIASLRSWTGRIGRAAAGGVVLTVAAAMLGIWLTRTPGPAGPSQSPDGTHAAVGTQRPGQSEPLPSALPRLLVNGDVPAPSRLIVNAESQFAVVDLGTGTIGPTVAEGQYGTVLARTPDGSLYCICLAGDGDAAGSFTHVAVTWKRYAGDVAARTEPVGDYRGALSPGDEADADQPQPVAVRVSYGTDPTLAFVGWTVHAHPTWASGIAVVDVTTGGVVQRIDLPGIPDGTDTSRTGVDAPLVIGSAGAGRVAIVRPWYRWSPPASASATYTFGGETTLASWDGARLSSLQQPAAVSACGDQATASGTLPNGSWWLSCEADQFGRTIVRRVGADDRLLGDTPLSGLAGIGGNLGTSVVSPDGGALFVWNPMQLVLIRVDLATGEFSTGTGEKTADAGGPLAALGRWLTPSAAAKMLLSPGIATSPDGTKIYALGIDLGAGGSAGLFVFDATGLVEIGRWTPTADYVSIAVSPDGHFVYAAGSPQVSADGAATEQAASITVFDASDGSLRLIAGQLGQALLLFPTTIAQ